MIPVTKKDFAPWLLLPGIFFTLSGASLLVPRQAALATAPGQAAPQAAAPGPKAAVYDDGDGDELLEHWDDPQFSREAQHQMIGMTAGFFVLGIAALRRRTRHCAAAPSARPSDACLDDTCLNDARKAA